MRENLRGNYDKGFNLVCGAVAGRLALSCLVLRCLHLLPVELLREVPLLAPRVHAAPDLPRRLAQTEPW